MSGDQCSRIGARTLKIRMYTHGCPWYPSKAGRTASDRKIIRISPGGQQTFVGRTQRHRFYVNASRLPHRPLSRTRCPQCVSQLIGSTTRLKPRNKIRTTRRKEPASRSGRSISSSSRATRKCANTVRLTRQTSSRNDDRRAINLFKSSSIFK